MRVIRLVVGSLALLALAAIVAAGGEGREKSLSAPSLSGNEKEVEYEFLGTKRCRMCHTQQYVSWLKSAKGNSWESLKPGVAAVAKTKAGLDPNKDYTTDPRCLGCHAVGYGEPGGYAIPDLGDPEAVRIAIGREGAGCESCHGPGSGFVQVMQSIYHNERPYYPQEVWAAGRRPVGPEVCAKCHNADALCVNSIKPETAQPGVVPEYVVDPMDRSGFHKKIPFKYRVSEEEGGSPAQGESLPETAEP